MLSGLPARIKGARHLCATEGSVVEQPAVFTREGHALGDTLIDNVDRHCGEAIHLASRARKSPL